MPFFVVMLSYIIMREKYPLKVCCNHGMCVYEFSLNEDDAF